MQTLKPLDKEAVQKSIDEVGRIVTIEDHNNLNGLGGTVAECIAEKGTVSLKSGCSGFVWPVGSL